MSPNRTMSIPFKRAKVIVGVPHVAGIPFDTVILFTDLPDPNGAGTYGGEPGKLEITFGIAGGTGIDYVRQHLRVEPEIHDSYNSMAFYRERQAAMQPDTVSLQELRDQVLAVEGVRLSLKLDKDLRVKPYPIDLPRESDATLLGDFLRNRIVPLLGISERVFYNTVKVTTHKGVNFSRSIHRMVVAREQAYPTGPRSRVEVPWDVFAKQVYAAEGVSIGCSDPTCKVRGPYQQRSRMAGRFSAHSFLVQRVLPFLQPNVSVYVINGYTGEKAVSSDRLRELRKP